MITKKSWEEFHKTGLLLFINQILQVFGWSIVFQHDDDGNIDDIYPARVKFRGFNEKSIAKSYRLISKFLMENSKELYEESKME